MTRPTRSLRCFALSTLFAATATVFAATPAPPAPAPDLSKEKTLYVVGYAHLDTQWRWSYPQVIREFIANTLRNNFPLIEKYPHYIFNFSGARRYEMMKEYYPDDYAKLKQYVAAGRWFPCGSSMDENDANVPSAESEIRHVLYGNHFFRREFGVASDEFMLPDCFGFPYALPSILAHCGIKGFSTQKLTWGSAVGIPFKVGVWQGPDGNSVIAALDPGSYTGTVTENLANSESWLKRIEADGSASGLVADYHYYGTGDRGGAPAEDSVAMIEKSATTDNAPIHVISSHSDWLFDAITPEQRAKLPVYNGELLLTQHSAGSVSSEAHMKRWNRKNELLADAAEKASVAAMWLGSAPYPSQRLYNAWDLVLGSQMHDMLPGTSLPKAYEFCWNDELLALNQFADVTTDAVGAVAASMDTQAQGVPLVVYNPISTDRQDPVEATVTFDKPTDTVQAFDSAGKEVPSQVLAHHNNTLHILFLAHVPSLSFNTFDVRPAASPAESTDLKVTETTLENSHYKVTLNKDGDISSIFDKKNNREVLSAPARLAFMYENPSQYPAWNMDWDDQQKPPQYYVDGPAKMHIVENGPARAAIEVERQAQGSKFIQRIRLTSNSDRIEFDNTIDWRTKEHCLKACFPFTVTNPTATYDIQLGTVQRQTDNPKKYEFPSHQWLDLTAPDNSYGASILSESKYGSDKPDDHTLRLTLIYTPGTRGGFQDQGTQDIGRHEFKYALAPHAGDWIKGQTPFKAARFNQPLLAFNTTSHPGTLGKSFSLLHTNSDQVIVNALKKAEDSDEVIVRLRNLTPTPAKDVKITTAFHIASAREVDGQERNIAPVDSTDDTVTTEVRGYGLKTLALKLAHNDSVAAPASIPLDLAYDTDVVSARSKLDDGSFDSEGRTLAAETFPATLDVDSIHFKLGPAADGAKNAISCHGQSIPLPSSAAGRLYLLAAANTDTPAAFTIGSQSTSLPIQSLTGYVGQWDNRLWHGDVPELTYDWHNAMAGLVPGYVKPATVAWFSSHTHLPKTGDEYYHYSYLFKYALDIPQGATALKLPDNPSIKIFAVTVASNTHDQVTPAHALYDTLKGRSVGAPVISPSTGNFTDATTATLQNPLYYIDGNLHYTTDGSAPTKDSPVYDGPIPLSATTTIKAVMLDAGGHPGPIASATLDVNDTTVPKATSAFALGVDADVRVMFSEPLDKASAENPANYQIDPIAEVSSAVLNPDHASVTLHLAHPLPFNPGKSAAGKYTILVRHVGDASPKHNAIELQQLPLALLEPVYRHDELVKGPKTQEFANVAKLPVSGTDSWTMNFLVKMAKQPGNHTLLAGFGSDKDEDGRGRYFAKFANGIHFWTCHRDTDTDVPMDLNQWQMLTATYDGSVLRLYKNARKIAENPLKLSDDEPAIRLFPVDPWDHKRHFNGQIKDVSVWPAALPVSALQTLWHSAEKE